MGELHKLKIIPLKENITKDKPQWSLDDSDAITAQFNPESLSLSKSNKWTFKPDIGDDVPETTYSGGNSGSMSIELLFDTTDDGKDVRKKYEKLVKIALVKPSESDEGVGEPRQVMVKWGKLMSYIAVVESISQTFSLFLPDGTPLRANVSVTLREVYDNSTASGNSSLPGQNPTSRTEVRRTWIVEKGQRLEWIAHNAYGTTAAWRHIAETNNLLNPAVLRPGQILKLVPLP